MLGMRAHGLDDPIPVRGVVREADVGRERSVGGDVAADCELTHRRAAYGPRPINGWGAGEFDRGRQVGIWRTFDRPAGS
jgi:hypothetical protein